MKLRISHHVLICATPNSGSCCNKSIGVACWEHLKMLIKKFNLEDPKRPEGIVLRTKVDCLRVCKNGPIMLIWPEGIWYNKLTPEKIERIVLQHILKGNPVKNLTFQKTSLNT